MPPLAWVRRGGEARDVEASTLVAGDIVLLAEGDRLSAGARLIDGELELDMSPLTGESQPVQRSSSSSGHASSVLEADNVVFAGSLCTAGEAVAVVYATGMATQVGRIAAKSQRVTPDQPASGSGQPRRLAHGRDRGGGWSDLSFWPA